MLRHSHNNIIIIVTNIVILEFLPTRFVHPGAPQLKILPFLLNELEHKNNETFNKLFFLTTMTSELLKYLNEQLGVLKEQK